MFLHIRKTIFVTSCFLAIQGIASSHGFAANDDPFSMKGFKEIKVAPGESIKQNVIELITPFIGNHPEALEGKPGLELSVRQEDGRLVFDLKKTGFLDDSIAGEHYHGAIIETAGGWELIRLHVKNICRRGVNSSGNCT